MDSAKVIRSDIMEIVFKIEDVNTLAAIRQQLQGVQRTESEAAPAFMEAVKPMRKDVSLEQLMQAQHYEPIEYKNFRENTSDLKWEESLEVLLSALTK